MGMAARSTRLALPQWARWNADPGAPAWSVGVEEEAMLLEPGGWNLASRIDDVLRSLSAPLAGQATAETHGSAIELATRPHQTVGAAASELAALRGRLAADLRTLGLVAAVAGTHPFATWQDIEVSPGARQQSVYDSMRELARREPTFALHVHVGVPDAESALRALDALREEIRRCCSALSANSPFWQGRETGLASARIPVFGRFPRVGVPRRFDDYGDYVAAIDVLLRCGAFPEPTFVWWDVRLQPTARDGRGADHGRPDARVRQRRRSSRSSSASSTGARVDGGPVRAPPHSPEVIDENRFLASPRRDARRADRSGARTTAAGARPGRRSCCDACAPHAAALGCIAALDGLPRSRTRRAPRASGPSRGATSGDVAARGSRG